jgi:hypothetical protein
MENENLCDICTSPVEGEAWEIWLESVSIDEFDNPTSDPLLCWECICDERGVCVECREVLNQDLVCVNGGCDWVGRGQG